MTQGNNKNAKAVAAWLDGVGHFPPMVVLEAETVAALMAALLVHDVQGGGAPPAAPLEHPWLLASRQVRSALRRPGSSSPSPLTISPISRQAFHGGSFRIGTKPEALGALEYLTGRLLGAAKQPAPAPSAL